MFKNHNILKDTLFEAKEKSFITIDYDYSILTDGVQNLMQNLVNGLNTSSSSQSTTECLVVRLTHKGELWLEEYKTTPKVILEYIGKNIFKILFLVVSIIGLYLSFLVLPTF